MINRILHEWSFNMKFMKRVWVILVFCELYLFLENRICHFMQLCPKGMKCQILFPDKKAKKNLINLSLLNPLPSAGNTDLIYVKVLILNHPIKNTYGTGNTHFPNANLLVGGAKLKK